MRYACPYCGRSIRQTRNTDGPNFCPHCRALFYMPEPGKTPSWVWGVVVVLVGHWQVVSQASASCWH